MKPDLSHNDTPPLFRADRVTVVCEAQKDGKLRVTCTSMVADYAAVQPGETFEIRWGKQGVEGRIVARVAPPVPPAPDEPDPFWIGAERADAFGALPTLSATDIAAIKSAGGPVLVTPSIGLTYGQTGGE